MAPVTPSSAVHASNLPAPLLMAGDFIRVRADHEDHTRAGLDGLVLAMDGDAVTLTFQFDRSNRPVKAICVGPEEWRLDELDLASVDRQTVLTAHTPGWQRIRATAH